MTRSGKYLVALTRMQIFFSPMYFQVPESAHLR